MTRKKQKKWKPLKPYLAMRARTKRLELRPYLLSDFPAWREAYLGRKKKQHRFDENIPKGSLFTKADFQKRVRKQRRSGRELTHFTFPIFERKTGRVFGFVGFNVISASYRWANLGYSVHNQYWGQGIGPEAAKLCLAIGFKELNLYRIEASCEVGNKASAKVALRAGLKFEGKRRKFFPRDGGVDLLVFAQNQIDYKGKNRGR